MQRKHWWLAIPAAIYFCLLLDVPYLLQRTVFYAFQTRDLSRAAALLNGSWIFYGPEMTGGGNLPGPFYYFLLLPSMLFGARWEYAWIEMIVLAAAAGAAAWWYLRAKGLPLAALFAVSSLALGIFTQRFLSLFINPSYQFILLVPLLILICEQARGRFFLGACALLGLALQVHFSVVFLLPALIVLGWRSQPRSRFWLGLAAVPLASIPYLMWGGGANYIGNTADVIPTLTHLARALFAIEGGNLFRIVWHHVLFNFPPVIWVLALTWLLVPRAGIEDQAAAGRSRALLKPLLICAAFGFVPFAYVFVVPIGQRYGLALLVSLSLISAIGIELMLASRKRTVVFNVTATLATVALSTYWWRLHPGDYIPATVRILLGLIAVILTFFTMQRLPAAKVYAFMACLCLIVVHREVYRTGEVRLQESNHIRYEHWVSAWTDIYRDTGWTVDQVKNRIYFVNTHIDGDAEPIYQSVMRRVGPRPLNPSAPDGYFVIFDPPRDNLAEWLTNQPINHEIREAIRDGHIRLGDVGWHGVWTVPYFVEPLADVPRHFHNWALYYNPAPETEWLRSASAGPAKIGDNRYLFKWNECPERDPYCNNAMVVDIAREAGGQARVTVKVIGESLSQNSPWIHPSWTQSWHKPYVELICGGRKEILNLARTLGFSRENMGYQELTKYFVANNSWLAPFERTFTVKCPGKISRISAGRASSTVDQVRQSITLPAQRLSLAL